jgi:hypothetical protein
VWAQAVGVADSVDLVVDVAADRQGCTQSGCVRLAITVRNAGTTERFVPRDAVDVRHVRLESQGREFRLADAGGQPHAAIRERLDPAGGGRDHLERRYTLPGCCAIVEGHTRLETLPPGRYVARYEASLADPGNADGGSSGVLRSTPIRFAIEGPAP